MKKLLRGLTVLFSIVLSIAGAYGDSGCPPNQYSVDGACHNCPTTFSSDLYEFVDYNYDGNSDDQNVTGQDRCTIKLIIGGTGSKCAEGTVVVYSYDSRRRKYNLRTASVETDSCEPVEGNNWTCALRKAVDPVRPDTDYCAECSLEDGEYYEDAEHRCRPCPDLNGGVGRNDSDMYSKLYAFIGHDWKSWLDISDYDDENHAYEYNAVYYGKNNKPDRSTLKASCAVEFNRYASSCPFRTNSGWNTYVEYDYNFATGKYELIGIPYIYAPTNTTDRNATNYCPVSGVSSCNHVAMEVSDELDAVNVNKDLCGTCNFVGNYMEKREITSCPEHNIRGSDSGGYEYCKACPDVDFDSNLYKFVQGTNNNSVANCTIKLKVGNGGSKCAAGTNVEYVYNSDSRKYELKTFDIVNPDCMQGQPCYVQNVSQSNAGTFNGTRDFCGVCDVGNGYYINGNGVCDECPAISSVLYEYTFVNQNECTIKLKVGGTNGSRCAAGTNVVYEYDFEASRYKLYGTAIVNTVNCNPTTADGTCVLRNYQDPTDPNTDYCVVCNVGNGGFYEDREHRCQACPNLKDEGNDIIGSYDSNKLYKFLPYPNHTSHSSSNQYSPFSNYKDSCAVVLNVDQSFCDNGTSVQYIYDFYNNKYAPNDKVSNNIYVAPCTDASTGSRHFKNYDTVPDELTAQTGDLCHGCATNEYYDGTRCQSCPECQSGGDCGTNDNEKLYLYTGYGTGTGITSCAVKLNLNKSNCGEAPAGQPAAGVVYVYNGSKYVRIQNYKVYNGRGYVLPVDERPKDDVLGDYCSTVCNNGYYLNGSKCEICPAGYSCPKIQGKNLAIECSSNNECDTITMCHSDEYSEAGAQACTLCAPDRTTNNVQNDGIYCSCDRSKEPLTCEGCSSPNACRAATDSASLCLTNDCSVKWGIQAFIEVLSTNRYVTQTVTKPSTGTD